MWPVAVLGSGLVGRGWAIMFARQGYEVHLYDVSESALIAAKTEIASNVQALSDSGLLEQSEVLNTVNRIHTYLNLEEALRDVFFVQECVNEKIILKQQLLSSVSDVVSSECIIASSTSALLPSELFEPLDNKERCLVCHPVNPPYLVPLVEIVPSRWTDESVINKVVSLMTHIGQKPIVLRKEIAGFVLNRLQVALVNEAISLVRKGIVSVEEVDMVVRDGLGYRWSFMGPFETIDLNAPLGITDYLLRFTDMFALAGETTCESPFSEEILETLESQRRQILPSDKFQERQSWRDQKLMSYVRYNNRE